MGNFWPKVRKKLIFYDIFQIHVPSCLRSGLSFVNETSSSDLFAFSGTSDEKRFTLAMPGNRCNANFNTINYKKKHSLDAVHR